jgi:hypothetical protein
VDRGKRLEGALTAEVAAAYGLGGCVPSYDQFVQLWLNLPTTRAAGNFNVAVAVVAATSKHPLPDDWIRAAVPDRLEQSRWRRWDLQRTAPDGGS